MSLEDAISDLNADFAAEKSMDQINEAEFYEPGIKARMGMSAYLAAEDGVAFEAVFNDYESYSQGRGLTGDPDQDKSIQEARLNALKEINEPTVFEANINSLKRGGIRGAQKFDGLAMINYQMRASSSGDLIKLSESNIKDARDRINERLTTNSKNLPAWRVESLNAKDEAFIKRLEENQIPAQQARVDELNAKRDEEIKDYIQREVRRIAIPMSSRLASFKDPESGLSGLLNPATFSELMAEELVASSPSLLAILGATVASGPVGGVAAGSTTALVTDFLSGVSDSFFEYLSNNEVDITNQESIAKAIEDKEFFETALNHAMLQGGAQGVTSAVSVGVASKGKLLMQAFGIQPGLAGFGEAARSWIVGESADIKGVLTEMLVEIPGGTLEALATRFANPSEKFRDLVYKFNGENQPARLEDLAKMVENASLEEVTSGMTPEEAMAVERGAQGDVRVQDLVDKGSAAANMVDELGMSETPGTQDPAIQKDIEDIKLLTEGIRSAVSEVEGNINVLDGPDMPLRTGNVKDGDPVDVRQEARAEEKEAKARRAEEKAIAKEEARLDKEQREQEKIFQEELKELNDLQEIADNPPPTRAEAGEEKLTASEEKTVQALLDHATGKKKLSAKRKAVLEEKVRGDIRTRRALDRGAAKLKKQKEASNKKLIKERERSQTKLDAQRTKFEAKIFKEQEKVANLEEKNTQLVNDAAMKIKEVTKKVSERFQKRIDKLKSQLRDAKHDASERSRLARELRQNASEAIRDLQAIAREQNKLLKGDKKIQISMTDIPKSANLNALTKAIETAREKIDKAFEQKSKEFNRAKIKASVKKEVKALSDARKGGRAFKSGPEMERYLQLIGAIEGPAKAEVQARVDKFDKDSQKEGYEVTDEDMEALRERAIVDIKDIDKMELSSLEEYIADFNSIKAGGLTTFKKKKKREKLQREKTARIIKDEINSNNPQRGDEQWKRRSVLKKFVADTRYSMLRAWTQAQILTGKTNSKLQEIMSTLPREASGRRSKRNAEFAKLLQDDMKKHNVDLDSVKKTQVGEVGGRPVSLGEAMFWYANTKNNDNKRVLNNTKWGNGQLVDRSINPVIESMPQNYKDFVDAQIKRIGSEQYALINEKLFKPRYGIDMPKHEGYFPLNEIEGSTSFANATKDYASRFVSKTFTKGRAQHNRGFKEDNMDFFSALVSNEFDVNHAVEFEPVMDIMNAVFDDADVQAGIKRFSPSLLSYIKDHTTKIASGKITNDGHWMNQLSEWLRKRSSVVQVGFNMFSAAKAFASFPMGLRHVNKSMAMSAAVDFSSNPIGMFEEAKKLSVFMAERGNESVIREVNESRARTAVERTMGNLPNMEKLRDKSFAPIVAVDRAISTVIWHAKFRESMELNADQDIAVRDADSAVEQSQQAGTIETLPSAFTNGGLARLWTQYLVDVNQLYNNIESQIAIDPRSVKGWSSIAAFGVLMPSMILAMTDFAKEEIYEGLGFWDEEDELDGQEILSDMAQYSVGQVSGTFPLLNRLIAVQLAKQLGDDQNAYFLSTFDPPAWAALQKAARLDISDPSAKELTLLGSYALGIPAGGTLAQIANVAFGDSKQKKNKKGQRKYLE